MADNLQAQYDEVVNYLNDYRRFVRKFSSRLLSMMFKSPRECYRLNNSYWKTAWRFDPLSEKTQDTSRLVVLACASDDDKRNPFFAVAISEYQTDALTNCLMEKFSSYDFAKLKKVHDFKQAQLARFSLKQILGVISATAALVIKSTPKNVIEGTFGMDYDDFEKDIFWITVFLAGYLLICFLLPWLKYYQARRTNQRVGDILEYAVIKNS